MNVEFARHAVKFSHTFSDFVDVRCREQSVILLRGPDCKKPDRLAANQSAHFARIPDRKQIIQYNILHNLTTIKDSDPTVCKYVILQQYDKINIT